MEQENKQENRFEETMIEGRNAVLEAFRSGKTVDKLFVLDGCQDGPVKTITREAKKQNTIIHYVAKERLDQLSETGKHQGVIAQAAAYRYAEVEDMLKLAEEKGEPPFLFILDGIEDPHNLGAIIRSAECVGAHGVIVPERRAVGLTPAAVKASAGAIEHIKVARVVNMTRVIEMLKARNIWTYALTMDGTDYEKVNFKGGVALVVGSEGEGISHLVLENCDQKVSLPMAGHLDSLNASVAAGVVMYRVLSSRRA